MSEIQVILDDITTSAVKPVNITLQRKDIEAYNRFSNVTIPAEY